jgi:hypothetical protein
MTAAIRRPLLLPYMSDDGLWRRVAVLNITLLLFAGRPLLAVAAQQARYIMAAGGAGSSGLPRLASGKRTNNTPSNNKTAKPAK